MKHDAENCPIAQVALLLSDAWTMLIIRDLIKGKLRYSELATSLTGISSRTLSLKLKRLEEMGIISKEDPFYLITKKGKKIDPILKEMSAYGKKYL